MLERETIDDQLCVRLPGKDKPRLRWWWLRQPPPTVAFALQARLSAALGPAGDAAVRLVFRLLDPVAEEDLEAGAEAQGDALALRAWRRARAGLAISDGRGGEAMQEAGDRLRAVLGFVASHVGPGGALDAAGLVGEFEREKPTTAPWTGVGGGAGMGASGPTHRWTRHGLLHVLLHESKCRWQGDGDAPRKGSWAAQDEPESPGRRLALAAEGHSIGAYAAALDAVLVSPEELALLAAWAALHLYRPF
jgi:hypothetical protein